MPSPCIRTAYTQQAAGLKVRKVLLARYGRFKSLPAPVAQPCAECQAWHVTQPRRT